MTTGTQPNEEFLVQQAQRDLTHFKDLYELYFARVYRYVYYRVNKQEEAEDLTSHIFLQALRAFPRFQWRQIPFGAWLFRIAHHAVVNHYKKIKPLSLEAMPDHFEPQTSPTIASEIDVKIDFAVLHRHLVTLPPITQHVIALRFTQELSFSEIAATVGKSEAAVKMMLYRGCQRLNKLISHK